MTMYDRTDPVDPAVIDRWEDGVGWIAHPEEDGRRAGHALRGDGGVWIFDPLDAPGVADLVADLGDVAGVAVLSGYHARDADAFADRYDVPVHVPSWIDRAAARINAPTERFTNGVGGFEVRELHPLRAWHEAIAYREADGTLYVPDFLAADPAFTVAGERLSMNALSRLTSPPTALDGLEPDRILFGHGEGVFEDATGALADSLSNARRRFPRALVTSGWTELRAMLGAYR